MATDAERIVLTYEDLREMPEDGNRYELYDGELEVTAAPTSAHQWAQASLGTTLFQYVRDQALGVVLFAPIDVRLSDTTVLQPDLVFVAKARREIIRPGFIAGPPDLVVEILSPSTADRDWRAKRNLYARFGVPHYWLIDPDTQTIFGLERAGDRYTGTGEGRGRGIFSAPPFPDLIIHLADLWLTFEPSPNE